MEINTGSVVTITSEEGWKKKLGGIPLKTTSKVLKTVTGENIPILGEVEVHVEHNRQNVNLPILVTKGQGPTLLGHTWLNALKVDWSQVQLSGPTNLEDLLAKCDEQFKPDIGELKGFTARLVVDPEATPKLYQARSVPYALRQAIEDDLRGYRAVHGQVL